MRLPRRTAVRVLLATLPLAAAAQTPLKPAPRKAVIVARLPGEMTGAWAAPRRFLAAPPPAPGRALFVVPPPRPPKPYQRLFKRLLAHTESTDRYDAVFLIEASRRGLDPRLLKAIAGAESEFSPRARSPRGALGVMQILPSTAEAMGTRRRMLHDPGQNIKAGAAYVALLYGLVARRYHLAGVRMADAPLWAVERVVAAYHAGPRFVLRNTSYPSTREYVRKVMMFYRSRVTQIRR